MAMGSKIVGKHDDNKTRLAILDAISYGEMSIHDLETMFGISDSTARYHSEHLVKQGKAVLRKRQNKEFLGTTSVYPLLLANEVQQDIVTILNRSRTEFDGIEYNGMFRHELARRLKTGPNNISWHVKRLDHELMMAAPLKLGRSTLLALNGNYEIVNNGYVFKDGMHYYGRNHSVQTNYLSLF